MKKLLLPFVALAIILLTNSCSSVKKVTYFQNIDEISLEASRGLYEARIMPKDELSITVITTDPAASAPFNLAISPKISTDGRLTQGGSNLQGFLVDNNGDIEFPIIGKIHVAGLTKNQCQDFIKEKIMPYMAKEEKPIVTVRMASYHIAVTGEVKNPGVFSVPYEKMNVIEALTQAGDLTIYGKRDRILLIREDNTGEKSYHWLNINDANILNSPYYYLQQNDIIYVEPNKTVARNSIIGSSTTLWFSFFGIVTSLASLIVNIVK